MAESSGQLLNDAQACAKRLVESLEKQQAEFSERPPKLTATMIAAGNLALRNAISAAREALSATEQAIKGISDDNPTQANP